jgi:phospholipid/cholesterol/gamma-HCH transport system ATP-binding protein
MAIPLIQFINVSKNFGESHVLKGLNLSIYKGEITAVIGKSGTGKSVLLKHIIGLVQQDSGQILIEGQPLSQLSPKKNKIILSKIELYVSGQCFV